jgi:hypothetical protein
MSKKILAAAALAGCAVFASTAWAEDAPAEKTVISGKGYFNFSNIDNESNGDKVNPSGTGIDVKRFYVGIDHTFDATWSANVTTDFNYISNDSETQVYIKKAYLQAKINDAFIVRAGSADLPWVPFAEGLYGYRWVENVMIDHLKFGTSADWGLHAGGKLADGMFNYAAAIINGAGYKNPSRSKSMDFEARVNFVPIDGLTLAAGYYNGKLGKETQTVSAENTAQRIDALVAFVKPAFRVGAEYFQTKNWNQVLTEATDKADGFSVWGSFNFTPAISAFARYDSADLSKDINSDLSNDYFNVGVAYKPRKNIDLALVYKQDNVDNGLWSTSNGAIGGTDGGDGRYKEIGIWSQVAF